MSATTMDQPEVLKSTQRGEALLSLNAAQEAELHKSFFRAAIGVILTLGAVWGAILLLRIGFLRSFTSVSLHEVNAHGHAQIFGWVGLFVMGFAYQMFPRFKQVALPSPKLARATLAMMIGGILLRSTMEPFVRITTWSLYPALLGGAVEIAALTIFAHQMWQVFTRSLQKLSGSDVLILSALGWLLVQALYTTWYLAATALAPTRDALLHLVSLYQAPLRDIQIHGFAMLMVFGVSQRILPMFFGTRTIGRRSGFVLAALLNISVVAEVAGFFLMRSISYRWAAVWGLAALLMTACAVWQIWGLGIFRSFAKPDRSAKFVRVAHVWLLISLAMLLVLPVWQFVALPRLAPTSHAVEIGFSHAYYGSIRHAITVGFISLMILGIGAYVARESSGLEGIRLTSLWIPFILVNLGCAMRVGFQLLTDINETAFPVAGVSGLLEVTGIAFWSAHMIRLMARRIIS
jgi:hypothetical protein